MNQAGSGAKAKMVLKKRQISALSPWNLHVSLVSQNNCSYARTRMWVGGFFFFLNDA